MHHPGMMMDIAHRIGDGAKDPIQILLICSLLRDDVPWLYELGVEVYRNINSGNAREARKAHRKFIRALEMLRHGPFMDEMDKHTHMMVHDALSMIELNLEQYEGKNSLREKEKTENPEAA